MRVCSIEGCEKKTLGRGWCRAHYLHWKSYGHPVEVFDSGVAKTCSVHGCKRGAIARSWCNSHYNRWRKFGDPLIATTGGDISASLSYRQIPRSCSIEGCAKRHKARGFCAKHFQRLLKNGDPFVKEQVLAPSDHERFWSKVEKNSNTGCWNWIGPLDRGGYGYFHPNFGRQSLAHRYCYSEFVGPIPLERPLIDHKCRNRSCVNPDHLRAVTAGENAQNRATLTNSTSGFRGVHYDPKKQQWFGVVQKDGRRTKTQGFSTVAEAHEAVSELRRRIFTHSDEDWQEQPGTGVQVQVMKRGSNQ